MLFTPTVIKNLLKKPATRKYPFDVREPFPNYRGELVIDIDKCIFCGMCSRKCPSQCITVDKAAGTWQCDPHACVYCGLCRDNCPTKCLSMKDVHRKPVTEKITWIEHGNPPKPKKKAAAPKAEAKAEAKSEKKDDKKTAKKDDK
jgi:formate hydrogenlyase subunit 6/NADH:ubiquinone oxidoreductase subunit I